MLFKENKSLNFSKKTRSTKNIHYLIIHYTGMQSGRVSMDRLKNPKSRVSCHYFIERNGDIYKMVEDNKIAWHAGKSKWGKIENLNINSIGIELVNNGHKFGYQKFSARQINALVTLCIKLKKKYKIKNRCILGHSDIAPLRKSDPGEKFPWLKLKKKKIGIWYSLNRKSFRFKEFKANKVRKTFFKNLYKIGYRYFNKEKFSKTDKLIIKSFQRRFRQGKVNGKIDLECIKISDYLAKNH